MPDVRWIVKVVALTFPDAVPVYNLFLGLVQKAAIPQGKVIWDGNGHLSVSYDLWETFLYETSSFYSKI